MRYPPQMRLRPTCVLFAILPSLALALSSVASCGSRVDAEQPDGSSVAHADAFPEASLDEPAAVFDVGGPEDRTILELAPARNGGIFAVVRTGPPRCFAHTSTRVCKQDVLARFDSAGKELWRRPVGSGASLRGGPGRALLASVAEGVVVATDGEGGARLTVYDANGEVRASKPLSSFPSGMVSLPPSDVVLGNVEGLPLVWRGERGSVEAWPGTSLPNIRSTTDPVVDGRGIVWASATTSENAGVALRLEPSGSAKVFDQREPNLLEYPRVGLAQGGVAVGIPGGGIGENLVGFRIVAPDGSIGKSYVWNGIRQEWYGLVEATPDAPLVAWAQVEAGAGMSFGVWTPSSGTAVVPASTSVQPTSVVSDGVRIWVAGHFEGTFGKAPQEVRANAGEERPFLLRFVRVDSLRTLGK